MRALLLLVLAGCTQPQAEAPALAIDQCALQEYREECEAVATGDDLTACYAKAKAEALRIQAGIPAQCRAA
jgi:hypothetical protein